MLQGRKWHQGYEAYGKVWQKGDVIGSMLDMTDKTISKLSFVFQRLYFYCIFISFKSLSMPDFSVSGILFISNELINIIIYLLVNHIL